MLGKTGIGLCLATMLLAQVAPAQTLSKFKLKLGGGFTNPVKETDGNLDTGFNLVAGAGVNFVPHFGIMAEFGFNQMGIPSAILSDNGVPDGAARIYSVTLNPIVHFNPQGRFDTYVVGGGGYYRRTLEFTTPGVTTVTGFDPFYGIFYPVDVPVDVVLGSYTQNKGGVNIGGGFSVRVKEDSPASFFAEARYHHIFTSPVATSYVPVTFGFRW